MRESLLSLWRQQEKKQNRQTNKGKGERNKQFASDAKFGELVLHISELHLLPLVLHKQLLAILAGCRNSRNSGTEQQQHSPSAAHNNKSQNLFEIKEELLRCLANSFPKEAHVLPRSSSCSVAAQKSRQRVVAVALVACIEADAATVVIAVAAAVAVVGAVADVEQREGSRRARCRRLRKETTKARFGRSVFFHLLPVFCLLCFFFSFRFRLRCVCLVLGDLQMAAAVCLLSLSVDALVCLCVFVFCLWFVFCFSVCVFFCVFVLRCSC